MEYHTTPTRPHETVHISLQSLLLLLQKLMLILYSVGLILRSTILFSLLLMLHSNFQIHNPCLINRKKKKKKIVNACTVCKYICIKERRDGGGLTQNRQWNLELCVRSKPEQKIQACVFQYQ